MCQPLQKSPTEHVETSHYTPQQDRGMESPAEPTTVEAILDEMTSPPTFDLPDRLFDEPQMTASGCLDTTNNSATRDINNFTGGVARLLPENLLVDGLTQQIITTPVPTGPPTTRFIGATPFMSTTFCQLYTIKNKRTISLGPGGEHEHMFRMRPNCVVSNPAASEFAVSRNYTYFLPAIARVGVTETATTHEITTSFGEVLVMAESSYKYMAVEKNTPTWYRESNLYFENTAGPYQDQKFISEGYNKVKNVMTT
ncbi:hypothetical protein DFS34DRAFT_646093 [Phlyctochytrium arcticum]|nr:hypothetical protein DFS34DRAFT_646093 [Phlyctochytrium arcticum]